VAFILKIGETMKMKKINSHNSIDKSFLALGTVNNIMLNQCGNIEIIEKAVQRVLEIDDRMSAFKEDSDISKISRKAGLGLQEVHRETFDLIKKAVEFGELSNGAFDITMRPMIELWWINKKEDYIPTDFEIQETLKLVNYRDILLDEKNCSVALKNPGQSIDLGGIAKGYAADEVKRILLENRVESAIINLGGNVVTIGEKLPGQEWRVGIQNPLSPTGEYLCVLSATNKTVVTSGSNERFFIKDGVRYHHILDPRTGSPAQSELLSATAICSSSTDADAITTALFILGPKHSIELLRQLEVETIFVTKDLSITVSNGLLGNVKVI